jgi:hypothetical protein
VQHPDKGPKMAEIDNVVELMQAQLKQASNIVRDMARRFGVSYAIWPHVRETMERCQIDRIEVAEYLARCVVREVWTMLGVTRFRVESSDPADRIASVTVSVHGDIMTIEVMGLRIVD